MAKGRTITRPLAAKGNLFLGFGRGKVGDVVLYRQNGVQVSRAHNNAPANPKTDAQLVQRAVTATVLQAYRAGKALFNHSFEGKKVSAGSQSRFLSVNMRKLREELFNTLASGASASETSVRVVSPKAVSPVPNAYRVSEGSLSQPLFRLRLSNVGRVEVVPELGSSVPVGAGLRAMGITADDIFTIVVFGVIGATGGGTASMFDLYSPESSFGYIRLRVKESALSLVSTAVDTYFSDVFDIDYYNSISVGEAALSVNFEVVDLMNDVYGGGIAVIRSREASGERSTSDMLVDLPAAWGVAPENLLDSWQQSGDQIGSTLVLEGGGFGSNPLTPDSSAPSVLSNATLLANSGSLIGVRNGNTYIVALVGPGAPNDVPVVIPVDSNGNSYRVSAVTGAISTGSTGGTALANTVAGLLGNRFTSGFSFNAAEPATVLMNVTSVPYIDVV